MPFGLGSVGGVKRKYFPPNYVVSSQTTGFRGCQSRVLKSLCDRSVDSYFVIEAENVEKNLSRLFLDFIKNILFYGDR